MFNFNEGYCGDKTKEDANIGACAKGEMHAEFSLKPEGD
jgi:hypothetical protein